MGSAEKISGHFVRVPVVGGGPSCTSGGSSAPSQIVRRNKTTKVLGIDGGARCRRPPRVLLGTPAGGSAWFTRCRTLVVSMTLPQVFGARRAQALGERFVGSDLQELKRQNGGSLTPKMATHGGHKGASRCSRSRGHTEHGIGKVQEFICHRSPSQGFRVRLGCAFWESAKL